MLNALLENSYWTNLIDTKTCLHGFTLILLQLLRLATLIL